jgi:hypothetical protein
VRTLSTAEAYTRATPAQRAQWFGRPPFAKEAISYDEAHGAGTSWDTGPPAPSGQVDAGEVLAALDALAVVGGELEHRQTVELVGEVLDQAAADLVGWHLRQPRPDPTARPPLSQAERRRRELADLDTIRAMRE